MILKVIQGLNLVAVTCLLTLGSAEAATQHKADFTAPPLPSGFYGYHQFYKDFIGELTPAEDAQLCNPDQAKLRTRALWVLDHAQAYYDAILKKEKRVSLPDKKVYPASDLESEQFLQLVVKKWGDLLRASKRVTDGAPASGDGELQVREKDFDTMVETQISLLVENGTVPLPSFGEEEAEGKSYFGYSSLRSYFFLKTPPVSVSPISVQELAKRDEHPLQDLLFSNSTYVALHDLAHAAIMSDHFWLDRFDLGKKTCEQYRSCIRSVEKVKVFDKAVPKKQSTSIRKGLWFLLHEDGMSLAEGRYDIDRADLAEFIFEQVLEKKKVGSKKVDFSSSALLGKKSERKHVCRAIQHYVLEESVPDWAKTVLKQPFKQSVEKYGSRGAVPRPLAFFKRLLEKCQAQFPSATLKKKKSAKGEKLLAAHVQKILSSGYLEVYRNEIDTWNTTFSELSKHFKTHPDCTSLHWDEKVYQE